MVKTNPKPLQVVAKKDVPEEEVPSDQPTAYSYDVLAMAGVIPHAVYSFTAQMVSSAAKLLTMSFGVAPSSLAVGTDDISAAADIVGQATGGKRSLLDYARLGGKPSLRGVVDRLAEIGESTIRQTASMRRPYMKLVAACAVFTEAIIGSGYARDEAAIVRKGELEESLKKADTEEARNAINVELTAVTERLATVSQLRLVTWDSFKAAADKLQKVHAESVASRGFNKFLSQALLDPTYVTECFVLLEYFVADVPIYDGERLLYKVSSSRTAEEKAKIRKEAPLTAKAIDVVVEGTMKVVEQARGDPTLTSGSGAVLNGAEIAVLNRGGPLSLH